MRLCLTERRRKMSEQINSLPIIARVRAVFLSGRKVTAKELNNEIGFNDGRKVISTLRSQGMNIKDYRLNDFRKVYYLEPDKQLSLDFGEISCEVRHISEIIPQCLNHLKDRGEAVKP